MPIYEYRCEHGHTFEVMQRITDDPVVSCETCDAPVERVFHPVAVHFKGSGFYATDYGSRKRSRELKEAAEGTGKSSSKDDGASKSDSGSTTDKGSSADKASSSSTSEKKASSASKASDSGH